MCIVTESTHAVLSEARGPSHNIFAIFGFRVKFNFNRKIIAVCGRAGSIIPRGENQSELENNVVNFVKQLESNLE